MTTPNEVGMLTAGSVRSLFNMQQNSWLTNDDLQDAELEAMEIIEHVLSSGAKVNDRALEVATESVHCAMLVAYGRPGAQSVGT